MAKRRKRPKPDGKALPEASNQRDHFIPSPDYGDAIVSQTISHWVELADKVSVGNNARKKL